MTCRVPVWGVMSVEFLVLSVELPLPYGSLCGLRAAIARKDKKTYIGVREAYPFTQNQKLNTYDFKLYSAMTTFSWAVRSR